MKIPYVMGIIATRSLDKEVTGIKDLIAQTRRSIFVTVWWLIHTRKLRAGDTSPELKSALLETQKI